MASWDNLWGATLVGLEVDLAARRVIVTASVADRADHHAFEVSLEGVSDLRLTRPDPNSWDYAEITEAHVDENGPLVKVELVLWAEPNALVAICESATFTRRT